MADARTSARRACVLLLSFLILAGCGGKAARRGTVAGKGGGQPPRAADQAGTTDPSVADPEPAAEAPPDPGALPGAVVAAIGNNPDGRPQSGLHAAGLVYEVMAEGGITRFLAVFSSGPVEKIGPIRSVRPYLAEIARAYDAPLAHSGASADGYAAMDRLGIKSLDEIRKAGAAYWRSRDRTPPNNLYTSTDRILSAAMDREWGLRRPIPLPVGAVEGGEPSGGVTLTYADNRWYRYVTEYRWESGRYRKLVNGDPFTMEDGEPIAADNVIVLITDVVPTGDALEHVTVRVRGEGDALFFTGGEVYRGRWRKAAPESPFEYLQDGRLMLFAPGVTWVNVVGSRNEVVF